LRRGSRHVGAESSFDRALEAAHGTAGAFVDGRGACWEVGAALTAAAGIPKAHALVVGDLPRAHAIEGRPTCLAAQDNQ
jgi:hypothetical protein